MSKEINPNELRIGNLLFDRKSRLCEVQEIRFDEYEAPATIGGITSHPHKPIKLTEGWLLKFGFNQNGETKEENKLFTIQGEECRFTLEKIISFYLHDNNCFGTEIKYVHELQNLYFALTGEELEISEA